MQHDFNENVSLFFCEFVKVPCEGSKWNRVSDTEFHHRFLPSLSGCFIPIAMKPVTLNTLLCYHILTLNVNAFFFVSTILNDLVDVNIVESCGNRYFPDFPIPFPAGNRKNKVFSKLLYGQKIVH